MTTNQIALLKLQEEQRANLRKEELTSSQLQETARHQSHQDYIARNELELRKNQQAIDASFSALNFINDAARTVGSVASALF